MRGLGGDKRKSTGQKTSIIRNEYRDKTLKVPIRNLDVDSAKTMIATMLGRSEPAGPGIVHFPCTKTGEDCRGFDLATISEFTAEYRKRKLVNGFPVFSWHKFAHLDNHRLDCFVYALGAKLLTRIDFDINEPVRIKAAAVPGYQQRLSQPGPRRRRPPNFWGAGGIRGLS